MAAVLLLLLVVVIVRWMVTPFDDWVLLVPPDPLPAGVVAEDLPDAARYRCSAPFGGDDGATATDQATDALRLQTLATEPCDDWWPQRRILAIANLVAAAGAAAVLWVWSRRSRQRGDPTEPGSGGDESDAREPQGADSVEDHRGERDLPVDAPFAWRDDPTG